MLRGWWLTSTIALLAACTQREPIRAAAEPVATNAGSAPSAATSLAAPLAAPASGSRFALVELFTSEGCSSCPPADALLGEVVRDARAAGEPIYALSFHVDYWNYLGWRDPFSDAAYSKRQRDYAYVFRSTSVYTPQAVIGGAYEELGSDAPAVRRRIEETLARGTQVTATMTLETATDAGAVDVGYAFSTAESGVAFELALVERDVTSVVASGENSGRTFTHQNVVRALSSVPAALHGTVRLRVPDGVRRDHASLIGWAQRTETMEVLGGAAIDLPQASN